MHQTLAGQGAHDSSASKDFRLKRSMRRKGSLGPCKRGGRVIALEKACTLGPNLQLISFDRVLSVRVSRIRTLITSRKHSVSEGGPLPHLFVKAVGDRQVSY